MAYPEIVYQQLQNIIQREINYTTRDKMVKSPQRKRIVTLQDIANALLYFEGGSLAKELKRAGLDMTPSAFIQRRHQLNSGVFQDVLAAFGAQDMDYETFQGYRVCAVDGSSVNIARDPNAKTFVQHSGAPKGYNQVKVHAIYDVLSKMYLSAEIHPQPEQDEIGALEFLLTWYDIAGKVLLAALTGDDHGKPVVPAQLVTHVPYAVIRPLIGNVFMMIYEVDRTENNVIMDMPLVNVRR